MYSEIEKAENKHLNGIYKELIEIVGFENVIKLHKYYSGQYITFPKCILKESYWNANTKLNNSFKFIVYLITYIQRYTSFENVVSHISKGVLFLKKIKGIVTCYMLKTLTPKRVIEPTCIIFTIRKLDVPFKIIYDK